MTVGHVAWLASALVARWWLVVSFDGLPCFLIVFCGY